MTAVKTKSSTCHKIDLRALERQDLLLSMYAETLRFGVQIHVPRTASHRDLSINNVIVPKNKLILINTWLAHTNEAVWNTRKNAFPLSDFWGRRFLKDPKDHSSGPTRMNSRTQNRKDDQNEVSEHPYFSVEGLEGAWIPFGGEDVFTSQYLLTDIS